MFCVKSNYDVFLKVLFCSILSGISFSFLLLFFASPHLFSFAYLIIYGVIFSVIYLITGAPIQYFLHKKPNKFLTIRFLIYLVTGIIVNTIFFIIVSDTDTSFYLNTTFYFMIFSSSIIFWFYDLILLRR